MSDATNPTPSTSAPTAAKAGANGTKGIAMLVIGLAVGLIAGAFLGPFVENFFGQSGATPPKTTAPAPIDERSVPVTAPVTAPAPAPAAAPAPASAPAAPATPAPANQPK